ncbi:hypothetical protein F511_47432 [Dorcoceras hygrometricum]|uniref:Uncharacterized protein n=1 Tax=Dorcoceras hygrometricum TaxID=472368 RepID=A0A2Z6ZXI0_9LAMI|nr:hypothetical protein F511_47432 [Dorcoceras hygrometricum]
MCATREVTPRGQRAANAQKACQRVASGARPAAQRLARIIAQSSSLRPALVAQLIAQEGGQHSPPLRGQRASRPRLCAREGGAPPHVAAADGHAGILVDSI